MMSMRTLFILCCSLTPLLISAPTLAQSTALQAFPLGGTDGNPSTQNVKISVTYQFFMEGSTDTMSDQGRLADQGRKHLYLMLAQECVILKETIADSCSIERASVNAQLSKQSRVKNNGVRISGSASYRISLKPDEKSEKK